ncbi:MAG: hypothetical protein ACO1SX_29170 [Actinomycetota bacterium]
MKQIRMMAITLLAAIGVSLAAPHAAEAGSKGRRNTAIAAGAVGIYGIIKKKPLLAGVGTGVGIYSYMKSREAAKKERNRRVRRVRYVRRGGRVYRQVYYVRR